MSSPCDECVITADHPHFRFPTHLVHPEHGKPMVFNVWSIAVCPDCGAAWHRGTDNDVRLVGMRPV
jgi:hypothetical protein